MTKNLDGKIALVTGASRGIGRATALALAAEGAHVIALARTQGALEELDDEIQAAGGKATLIALDLLKLDEVDKLGPSIHEKFGRLDIFIGNAGMIGSLTPVHQIKPKDWDKVMALNFTSNLRLIQTLDPLLRAADAGRAVFVTSMLAAGYLAYFGAYAASKAALNAMATTYAAETKETNIRVNLVEPGAVDTDMLGGAFPGGYQGEMQKPEDVAKTILGLVDEPCKTHGEIVKAA